MKVKKVILSLILGLFIHTQAIAVELPKPMVEVDWLENHLEDVFILDVRNDLTSFERSPKFSINKETKKQHLVRVGGHIPGASKLKFKKVRGTQIVKGKKIKFNLPEKTKFETLLQQAGVNQNSKIVVVSNASSDLDLTMATRVYWQLKYFGHEEISLLNGGTAKWLIDGNKVETTKSSKPVGDWKVTAERKELLANSEEVEAAIQDSNILLVDVRPLAQYLGKSKNFNVKARGHIPTAKLYSLDLITTGSTPVMFSSKTELQQIADALGADTSKAAITYCNSGHMASGGWFVLHELLGNKNVKLYDGSMHQWTAENRQVVTMKME